MNTHTICFDGEITKTVPILSSNTLICSSGVDTTDSESIDFSCLGETQNHIRFDKF